MSGIKNKKKKRNYYFDKDVEIAIIEYNCIEDELQKVKLYEQDIRFAFHELAKNLINIYRVYNTGDDVSVVEHDTVSFLYQSIHKYNQERGKAFSFFNVIAKNFIVQKAQSAHRRKIIHRNIDDSYNELNTISKKYYEQSDTDELKELIGVIINDFSEWSKKKFKKEEDRKIAVNILYLIEKYPELDIYNKKQVFTYLKEMSDSKSKKIANVLSEFRKRYEKTKAKYIAGRY